MERYTQKRLRELRDNGAVDLTYARERGELTEPYTQIGYSSGEYGCSGMLLRGDTTGGLYVIIGRTTALWLF